ncbi:histidine phosphatase family protein [Neobacillus niacini]|uniref:histidine phosphatase family protein n=1 Tax=Neobacillus niacini TaxID=86668 RepID=UPI002FFE936D
MVIALFRHGLTEENKRRAYLGWNDSPLCPESMRIRTKNRYDHYFSSDLHRCITTVKHLFPNKGVTIFKELREMNFGEWEGKTYDDLKEDKLYQNWLSDPFLSCPPEGETFQTFAKRVETGWKFISHHIISNNYKSGGIVTHGGVMRYLLSHFAPEQRDFWSWQTPHNKGYELTFDREALRRGERCISLLEVPLMAKENG